jgi:ZIP family zinc transporter
VEPISGVLAAILAGWVTSALPLLLALAAGTMIYVVVDELIPQARMIETEKGGTLGFIAGFVVMMILDVAL